MKYDFIPAEVSIGRFNMTNAFVSCKYNYDKWQNVSIFERLCGFKPFIQRDPEKQLKKAIYNAVDTIENNPINGFKFIDHDEDLYGLNKKSYENDIDDVVLKDPRGFNIAITKDNFYYMLDVCNGNIKNFVFDHAFAYAWNKDYGRFMIVDAETEEFKKCKIESVKLKDKIDNNSYVLPRDLKVGHAYVGTDQYKGQYIYLGKMPIYGNDYHLDAIKNKKYRSMVEFNEDESIERHYYDMTCEQKFVFYRIGPKVNTDSTSHPFVFRSSVSKVFEREIDISGTEEKMFNDLSKKVSYENVREYMDDCPLFNKIDLCSLSSFGKPCDYDLFEKVMKYLGDKSVYNMDTSLNLLTYPFTNYSLKTCMYFVNGNCRIHEHQYFKAFSPRYDTIGTGPSYKGTYVSIDGYTTITGKYNFCMKRHDKKATLYCNQTSTDNILGYGIKDLYDYLKPSVLTAKYENGKDVKELHMLMLQGKYM